MYEIRVLVETDRTLDNLTQFIKGALRAAGLKPEMIAVGDLTGAEAYGY